MGIEKNKMLEEHKRNKDSIFKGQNVLVTGGAGFIGSHLVEALVTQGADVVALDNLSAGTWRNLEAVRDKVETITGDIRDAALLEKLVRRISPRFVFNLAANASVPGSVEKPRSDFESNCSGTVLLLDVLREHCPDARFILSSSAAVYGEPGPDPIGEEKTPMAPISPYGASKLAAEVESRIYHTVYGIPVVIGRVFNTYGPRMPRFVVLDFLKKLKKNPRRLEILGDGSQMRDFNFIGDTVGGLMLLASHGQSGKSYNIASGNSISVDSLARRLLDILKMDTPTEIYHSHKSWVGDARVWKVDISMIRGIGYNPRVSLDEGLETMIRWFESVHGSIPGR